MTASPTRLRPSAGCCWLPDRSDQSRNSAAFCNPWASSIPITTRAIPPDTKPRAISPGSWSISICAPPRACSGAHKLAVRSYREMPGLFVPARRAFIPLDAALGARPTDPSRFLSDSQGIKSASAVPRSFFPTSVRLRLDRSAGKALKPRVEAAARPVLVKIFEKLPQGVALNSATSSAAKTIF